MTTSSLLLDQLFEQFYKEKEYVKNSSRHTILFYQYSFQTFKRILGDDIDLTKNHLTRFVLCMREKGMKPATTAVDFFGAQTEVSHTRRHAPALRV